MDGTFYSLKEIRLNSELEAERFYKAIKYNVELLAEHYKNDLALEYKNEAGKRQQVYEIVRDALVVLMSTLSLKLLLKKKL